MQVLFVTINKEYYFFFLRKFLSSIRIINYLLFNDAYKEKHYLSYKKKNNTSFLLS